MDLLDNFNMLSLKGKKNHIYCVKCFIGGQQLTVRYSREKGSFSWFLLVHNVWDKTFFCFNTLNTSLVINIFAVPDTMFYTIQFVPDIKEIATDLYQMMTITGCLFQDLKYIVSLKWLQ